MLVYLVYSQRVFLSTQYWLQRSLNYPPLINDLPLHRQELVLQHVSLDLNSAQPELVLAPTRPRGSWGQKPVSDHRSASALHHVNWSQRLYVVGSVGSFKEWLCVIHRPSPFITVLMATLHKIYLVLIQQVLEVCSESSIGRVALLVGGVEGLVCCHHYPFCVPIGPGVSEVILEEEILRRPLGVVVFRGKVDQVQLAVVEGEPEVAVAALRLRQMVAVGVRREVVKMLVVAYSRHECNRRSPFLGHLSVEVPDGLYLSNLVRADSCVGNVSIHEHEVKRVLLVVVKQGVRHLVPHRHVRSHIPKSSKVDSWQVGSLVRRRDERTGFRICQDHTVSHPVVILLQWFQSCHHSPVNPSVEAKPPCMVGCVGCIH